MAQGGSEEMGGMGQIKEETPRSAAPNQFVSLVRRTLPTPRAPSLHQVAATLADTSRHSVPAEANGQNGIGPSAKPAKVR